MHWHTVYPEGWWMLNPWKRSRLDWGSEKPDLVEDVIAKGLDWMTFEDPFQMKLFYGFSIPVELKSYITSAILMIFIFTENYAKGIFQ